LAIAAAEGVLAEALGLRILALASLGVRSATSPADSTSTQEGLS